MSNFQHREKRDAISDKISPGTSVVSICDIAVGICSPPGIGGIAWRRLLHKMEVDVLVQVNIIGGLLRAKDPKFGSSWGNSLLVAENCHQQNVELTRSHQGLILRVIKPIRAGQDLFVWFAPDLLTELEIPFLHPSNIKGNQTYICHKCGHIFKNPNPLKVHLSIQCYSPITSASFAITNDCTISARENIGIPPCPFSIPNNAYSAIPRIPNPRRLPICEAKSLRLTSESVLNSSTINSPKSSTSGVRNVPVELGLSAYSQDNQLSSVHVVRPVVTQTLCSEPSLLNSAFCAIESRGSPRSISGVPTWSPPHCHHGQSASSEPSRFRIESPKLGGHTCVYCGKVYSRKYGLKIHVRTHTGYKPLKCRFCFRPFSDPSNLNKHVRLHAESDTPYRCPHCGKVLVRRRDLERHIKSRHPNQSCTKGSANVKKG